ncbi:MAG: lipid-A-disaccharide synthase [Verrucomicrobiota bacterium]|jgi:lipid-A-disaccharide synthase
MKLYVVAGESSGDARGVELLSALRSLRPDVQILGAGGPLMASLANGPFLEWTSEAVVGIWDVLKKYPYFRGQFDRMLAEIAVQKPDALLLIDYPGFNLRLAREAKKRHPSLKTIYYISPQVWAWHRSRIGEMARFLDLMLCIFPFEKQLYESSGLHTAFVGHPMLDSLATRKQPTPRDPSLIGLFPGSRSREIRHLFPVMLEAAKELASRIPGLRFEAAAASPALAALMNEFLRLKKYDPGFCQVRCGRFYPLMQEAAAGMVCSGTATLEAAYFGLPSVLLYKVAWPTWWIGKMLVEVPHLGMPNVLAGREILPEFLQTSARPRPIADALERLLTQPDHRKAQQQAFEEVIRHLGTPGAGARAAREVAALLE